MPSVNSNFVGHVCKNGMVKITYHPVSNMIKTRHIKTNFLPPTPTCRNNKNLNKLKILKNKCFASINGRKIEMQ